MTKPIIFLAAAPLASVTFDACAASLPASDRLDLAACLVLTLAALVLAYAGLRRSVSAGERSRSLQRQLDAEREARTLSDQALAANHDLLCRLVRQNDGVCSALPGMRAAGHADALRHALERCLAEHAQAHGQRYRFEAGVDPAAQPASRAARLAAFQVLQEVLDAAGARSSGAELHVRLSEGAQSLALDIQAGASYQAPAAAPVQQRISDALLAQVGAIGGVLRMAAAPGRPSHWSLSLPMPMPMCKAAETS